MQASGCGGEGGQLRDLRCAPAGRLPSRRLGDQTILHSRLGPRSLLQPPPPHHRRFDTLVGMFSGKDVPAVGVSIGIERIYNIMEEQARAQAKEVSRRPTGQGVWVHTVCAAELGA